MAKPPIPAPIQTPGPAPADLDPTGALAFAALDESLPVLLLPVRLETRFDGNTLRIRVYPDTLHVDALQRALIGNEEQLGKRYWTTVWPAPSSVPVREAAFRAVSTVLGARRGAHVVRTLTPTNLSARVTALANGKNTQPAPAWPKYATAAQPSSAVAALLPERWVAVGFRDGAEVFRKAGARIVTTLGIGPDPNQTSWANGVPDEKMSWMVDYAAALAKGMALNVTLDNTNPIDKILVLGVKSGTAHEAALVELVSSHHATRGAAFVPSGTPTNNTDGADAGYSAQVDDLAAFVAAEIPPTAPPSTSAYTNAAVLASALGIADASALHRMEESQTTARTSVRTMNRVLWHCSVGAFVRRFLAGESSQLVSDDGVAWLESWFVDHVHAPGPLPAFRVGPEPYGVLPVMLRSAQVPVGADVREQLLRTVLQNLEPTWQAGVPSVPLLNPDLGAQGATAVDEAFVDILTLQPDAFRFSVRSVQDSKTLPGLLTDGVLESYDSRVNWMRTLVSYFDDQYGASVIDPFLPARAIHGVDTSSFATIGAQIAWFDGYGASLTESINALNAFAIPDAADAFTTLRDGTLPLIQTLLAEHQLRVDPLRSVWSAAPGGVVGADDPAAYYSLYDADSVRVAVDLVQAADASGNATAAAYLTWLADRETLTATSIPAGMTSPPPLLFQLARESLIQAADAPTLGLPVLGLVQSALRSLATLTVPELELRLQQTLGLATHRLDAWNTAFAKRRLEQLRATKATGLQLGAYGWVHGLRADRVETSEGYIHAPSLQQAVTAAVLRSGWLAHRGDDPTPFAVDLQSERIRKAAWLFSGVRHGQSIGQLLGYQFERALHDHVPSLDSYIDDFRNAVSGSVRRVVDGLGLLDEPEVQNIVSRATDRGALQTILDDVAATLDAAADVSIAEAVHRLLQGDTAGTVATFSAISHGEAPPPELELPRTPRPGIHVTHRVLLLLPDSVNELEPTFAWPSATTSLRALAAPPVERWAEGVLGASDRIGCTITFTGTGAPDRPIALSLDALSRDPRDASRAPLPLAALDFAWMAPSTPDGAAPEALDLVRAWIARSPYAALDADIDLATFKVDPPVSTGVSMADAFTAARAIRDALANARPADARDLAADRSTLSSPGIDSAAAAKRARAVSGALDAALQTLKRVLAASPAPTDAKLRSALEPLAGWLPNVWSALAASGETLATAAKSACLALQARVAAAASETDSAAKLASLAGFPVPLPFVSNDATLAANLGASAARQGSKLAAVGWLNQIDRVREGAARLSEVLKWSEVLLDGKATDLAVLQCPHVEGEPWAGLAKPSASRVSIVAWPGAGLSLAPTAPLNALALDEWVESLPTDRQVTGLAFNYDAPAARAPQSLLLAVADAGSTWSLDHMIDTLQDTWKWMRRRAVAPEQIAGLGHYLPAILSDSAIDPGAGIVSYAAEEE